MGTNYYKKCRFCNEELLHIGKHSNNEFLSNMTVLEFKNVKFEHWEVLSDEYGNKMLVDEFFKKIPDKWVLVKNEFC